MDHIVSFIVLLMVTQWVRPGIPLMTQWLRPDDQLMTHVVHQ
jgi:hypothetical protein